MLFQKSLMGNSRAAQLQRNELVALRKAYEASEKMYASPMQAHGMVGNEGLIPQDVYQEFDNVTVERFRSDEGDTFLNDLLPLSRSLNIGKLTHKYRKASDAGLAQTSMSGQTGVKLDQVEYNYDGSIIPIHDIGFGRNFREFNAHSSEGFDALIDDQRESIATLRRHLADSFLDGHTDANGNYIVVDGISWQGIRNDSRVASVDLGAGGINFDFTNTTKTYSEIEAAFKQVRDVLYITNNCERDATYYISREIMSNIERNSSESYSSSPILNRLAQLMGVAAIKVSSKLSGNELFAIPLSDNLVRPLVGMAINTVAMPRAKYNDDYAFVSWGAIGWEVRTDYAGNNCALYASA